MEQENNKLGLIGLIAIVVSSMIGGGIFNLPSNMSIDAGFIGVTVSWIVTAVGIYFLANTFSILSDNNPELHSGIYSYARAGFGKFVGCEIAWGYWLSSIFGNVAFAVLLMQTIGYFYPVFNGHNIQSFIGGSAFIWLMYFIVICGVTKATFLNNIATFAKLLVLVVILFFFAKGFNPHIASYDMLGKIEHLGPLTQQVKSTMLITLWCFIGLEGAVVLSGRARNPKDVGKATLLGILICIIIFSALSILSFGVLHQSKLAYLPNPSTAYVLEAIVGQWGATFVNVGIIIALLGCWLSWTIITAEVPYIAAKDGVFPKFLVKTDKNDTPTASLLMSTIAMQLAMFIVLYSTNAWLLLVDITGLMILPPYTASTLFLLKEVRNKNLKETGKGKIRIAFVSGLVACIFTIWLLFSSKAELLLISTTIFSLGIAVYAYSQKEVGGHNIFAGKDKFIAFVLGAVGIISFILLVSGKLNMN
ncbi:amino acid permease [Fusobacterium perfoetens]|uniref:basic amino acid/polyamine antiporter n=1 Tax=Fusobacterium perfoetens TaxID=852 RepID=UPI001F482813|nr:basic amino acid/polyamine antiporter [Fusobacterium perfoetens]MCF2626079.1 amino acid permease [Fusobacterium perfoetens]